MVKNNEKSKDYYLPFLRSSIMWLEKYIEIANYYSDWEQRKQTDDSPITRKDINESKDKVLHPLGTCLMCGFEGELDEENLETREDLKQEFYKWLNTSGINVDNAPTELKCALFEFHEILECRFEKARHDRASRKREIEIDSPEYLEKLQELFGKTQEAIQSGKTNQMDGSRFSGNAELGKKTFEFIVNSLSTSERANFHFWPQKTSEERENNDNNKNTPTNDKKPEKTDNSNQRRGKIEQEIKILKAQNNLTEQQKRDLKDKEKELDKLINNDKGYNNNRPLMPLYICLAAGGGILIGLVIFFLIRTSKRKKKN